jgi:hypothetical protein
LGQHSCPARKSEQKFIYGVIREGARAKNFETAIQWLTDAGLLHKVYSIPKPALPLVEVKAGISLKSTSFGLFCEKNKPAKAIRISLADYKKEE